MSLLMDALRKAEADKKQASAAPSGSESGQPVAADIEAAASAATREFRHPGAGEIASPEPPATPAPETPGPGLGPQELSLEPLEADRPRARNDAAMGTDALDATLVGEDDSISTLPPMDGAEARIEDAVEESQSTPLAPEAVVETREASLWGSRSGITETVAAANTVFAAGTSGPPRRTVVWAAVITVVIGCGLAGAGFYYFQQPLTAHQIPSPNVALNVEKSPPRELPIVATNPTTEAPVATVVSIELIEPIEATGADDTAAQATAIALPAEPLLAEEAGPPPAQLAGAEPRPQPFDTASAADVTSRRSQAPGRESLVSAIDGMQIGVRPGEVRIARSDRAGDVSATMNQAYAAYVAGNFAQAGELYQQVLSQRPQQRDALLGVAALKLRSGEVASAHRIYRQVLKRYPDNPTASAALFSIEGGSGDQVTEARLKMLLDQGVDVGYIYFCLGNLYARNHRWGDAQQAYFAALRNNPANPDYNYNLAVSLDRIGQRVAAVKYYDVAVSSTDAAEAGFDPASALARIQAITSAPSR